MLQKNRFFLEAIAIIVIAVIIGVLITFYSRILGPPETTVPVVVSEVYLSFTENDPGPHQWFELYNRTKDWQTLKGWDVETGYGVRLDLPDIDLPPHGYAIVAGSMEQFLLDHEDYPGLVVSPEAPWPGLDRKTDFLVLRTGKGDVVDAINWGAVEELASKPEGVELWNPGSFGGALPWLFNEDKSVAQEYSYERRPIGSDRDQARDFTIQPWPSPGTVNAPSATRAGNLLFIDWTNVASYAGGIILWVAFVYIAMIARRFEALTQQRTFWQAMLFTPSGILFYNIIQAVGFLARGRMTGPEKWWGFTVLFISALLCTALVYIFRERAKRILEA